MKKPKASLNQPVHITRKHVYILGVVMAFVLLLTLGLLIFVLASQSTNHSNYQTLGTQFTQLEATVAQSSTTLENIDVLDKRLNQLEVENKKIKLDYDNLNMRSARNEQDIFVMNTIVSDKNLDNKLERLESRVNTNTTDIAVMKRIQTGQQTAQDDIKEAFEAFKNSIVNKITAMLSSYPSSGGKDKKKLTTTKPNFNFQLSSIEYRAGEHWAVFAPKSGVSSISELKLLTIGDVIAHWTVTSISGNAVQLTQNGHQLTLSVH